MGSAALGGGISRLFRAVGARCVHPASHPRRILESVGKPRPPVEPALGRWPPRPLPVSGDVRGWVSSRPEPVFYVHYNECPVLPKMPNFCGEAVRQICAPILQIRPVAHVYRKRWPGPIRASDTLRRPLLASAVTALGVHSRIFRQVLECRLFALIYYELCK